MKHIILNLFILIPLLTSGTNYASAPLNQDLPIEEYIKIGRTTQPGGLAYSALHVIKYPLYSITHICDIAAVTNRLSAQRVTYGTVPKELENLKPNSAIIKTLKSKIYEYRECGYSNPRTEWLVCTPITEIEHTESSCSIL